MPDDIYVKHYFGESADRPEVENGTILYETDTRALFVDQNNQRTRYNPPANWNETDTDDPSYIENKPTLGTASARNVASEIGENNDIPTAAQVNEAIQNVQNSLGTVASHNVATSLDSSENIPTASVVKEALDTAKSEINNAIESTEAEINQTIQTANTWKLQGNPEDVLSKDSNGNLSWVDIQNALYWYEPISENI